MSFILADCVQRERMDLKFSVRTHPSGGSPENPIGTMFLPTRWSISLRWINMSRELGMMVCVWKKSVVWRSINCQHLFLDSWVKCLLFLYSNSDTHQRLFSQNLVQPQNWNFPRPDQQNDDVNNQGSFSLISSKLLSFWSANDKKVFVYRQSSGTVLSPLCFWCLILCFAWTCDRTYLIIFHLAFRYIPFPRRCNTT